MQRFEGYEKMAAWKNVAIRLSGASIFKVAAAIWTQVFRKIHFQDCGVETDAEPIHGRRVPA